MREKMIELIAQKVCDTWSEYCDEWQPHDCGKCYANDCHIAEIADHLIANGVTFATDNNVGSKWIPVSEMMPESHVEPFEDIDGTHYIVVSNFVLGYTDKGEILCVQHEVGDERDWWLSYDCSYHTVTHWMPLPEPPKGE